MNPRSFIAGAASVLVLSCQMKSYEVPRLTVSDEPDAPLLYGEIIEGQQFGSLAVRLHWNVASEDQVIVFRKGYVGEEDPPQASQNKELEKVVARLPPGTLTYTEDLGTSYLEVFDGSAKLRAERSVLTAHYRVSVERGEKESPSLETELYLPVSCWFKKTTSLSSPSRCDNIKLDRDVALTVEKVQMAEGFKKIFSADGSSLELQLEEGIANLNSRELTIGYGEGPLSLTLNYSEYKVSPDAIASTFITIGSHSPTFSLFTNVISAPAGHGPPLFKAMGEKLYAILEDGKTTEELQGLYLASGSFLFLDRHGEFRKLSDDLTGNRSAFSIRDAKACEWNEETKRLTCKSKLPKKANAEFSAQKIDRESAARILGWKSSYETFLDAFDLVSQLEKGQDGSRPIVSLSFSHDVPFSSTQIAVLKWFVEQPKVLQELHRRKLSYITFRTGRMEAIDAYISDSGIEIPSSTSQPVSELKRLFIRATKGHESFPRYESRVVN